jgi:hypothetical protein
MIALQYRFCLTALAALAVTLSADHAWAQQPPGKEVALSKQDRADMIAKLETLVETKYVFPEQGKQIKAGIAKAWDGGTFAGADNGASFSMALTQNLRQVSSDRHFLVSYDPEFTEDVVNQEVIKPEDMAHMRSEAAGLAYGIEKLQRLPGNVGYIELRGFGPTEIVGPAYDAAMALLGGTDALIIDLRRNGGGDPSSVAYWMSHFFPSGNEKHLNDIYDRNDDSTRQYWTVASVTPRYDKPVTVLISPRTFSGGEECAYDFQTQKRALIVGETSGGGAHPVNAYSLGHGFVVNLPTGRAINPITKTDWEGVGVKPDVKVAAADALWPAYQDLLRGLLKTSKDPEIRESVQHALSFAEKKEFESPRYSAPH